MKRVAILFDLPFSPPENQNYRHFVKDTEWDCELDVKRALQRLGFEAHLLGVHDDLTRLVSELNEMEPDYVFNMSESFRNRREHEPQVAGVLELLGLSFTGSPSLPLAICQNKALSKKILAHHRIRVPQWISSPADKPLKGIKKFRYPAFVKPDAEEGSEGIAKDSLVENEKDCLDRIKFLHEKFGASVVVEEFIPGREIYVAVLGTKRRKVLPIRELTFKNYPEDEPRFATYRVKWDENYRKKWGIRNEFAKNLSPHVIDQATRMAKKAFDVLGLQGYARFDMRVTDAEEVVMLEANPNPSITSYDDFALSAKKAGMDYDELIKKILDLAVPSGVSKKSSRRELAKI